MNKVSLLTSEQICNMLGLGKRDAFVVRKKYTDGSYKEWHERLKEIGAHEKLATLCGGEEE